MIHIKSHSVLTGRIIFAGCAAFAIAGLQSALSAQSALEKKYQSELAQANQSLIAVQTGSKSANADKATALKEKGKALAELGRTGEAVPLMREAMRLAPDDFSVLMHSGAVFDVAGDHEGAASVFVNLSARVQAWQEGKIAARKAGTSQPPDASDAHKIAVALEYQPLFAINCTFRGKYAQALAIFTKKYEASVAVFDANETSDYAACWRLWLTQKVRAADGMHSATVVEILAKTLKVSTPYHVALLQFYLGKNKWPDVLAAINAMQIDDAKKEVFRTQAHLFAAGYLRYDKRDTESALRLLETENARPFNGCVERLIIQSEIQSIKSVPSA